MAVTRTLGARISGIVSSVPPKRFDNLADTTAFPQEEVQKVVRMAGVKSRHLADDSICSSDLCFAAGQHLLAKLQWDLSTIDALIFVTQTADYLLPSTACLLHHWLKLPDTCAAFDVGLGCSGYPYGLWMAAMMLQSHGFQRVLMFHGETPTRFSDPSDRAVALLFGDAGSATALEAVPGAESVPWWFSLHTDGSGWRDLLIEGGGFRNRFPSNQRLCNVVMNGANIFNFTLKRVPPLIEDTLKAAGKDRNEIDYYIFHQSNLFIMRHLVKKVQLPEDRIPITISDYGSAGGPSVALTMTRGKLQRPADRALTLLLLGYGVGLSWASALIDLHPTAILDHVVMQKGATPGQPAPQAEGKTTDEEGK